jgi:hypothetical protein
MGRGTRVRLDDELVSPGTDHEGRIGIDDELV